MKEMKTKNQSFHKWVASNEHFYYSNNIEKKSGFKVLSKMNGIILNWPNIYLSRTDAIFQMMNFRL